MVLFNKFTAGFCFIALLALTPLASAEWTLQKPCSSLTFTTSKTLNIAQTPPSIVESGYFHEISSTFSANAEQVLLHINLDSVDTGISIRDERVRKLFFTHERHARIKVPVTTAVRKALESSTPHQAVIELAIELGAKKITQAVKLNFIRSGKNLTISTVQPVMLSVSKLGLIPGLNELRKIAVLASISPIIPVYAHLCYRQN